MKSAEQLKELADTYLDDMLEAEAENDYARWSQYFEPQNLAHFSEKEFLESMSDDRKFLGNYVRRHDLGVVCDLQSEYTQCLRFVYHGIFDKAETIMVLGVYEKEDGSCFVNENMYY